MRVARRQFLLHFFQCHPFRFGIDKEHNEELQNHHDGEENEWIAAGRGRQQWK